MVLTDLSPEEADVCWYGMRTWIESGFKDFKRGLWGWHHSKMQEASRVERLWLAMAVAQVWTADAWVARQRCSRSRTILLPICPPRILLVVGASDLWVSHRHAA